MRRQLQVALRGRRACAHAPPSRALEQRTRLGRGAGRGLLVVGKLLVGVVDAGGG
jgi:hypothetical protein